MELIGSVLKLFILYKRYGWQLESQFSTTKGENWISQRRHSLGKGKALSFKKNIGYKRSVKLKMLGW